MEQKENKDSFVQRIKNALGSKNWWLSSLGGIFSTVIGILLTFGVGALINYRNDQKLAREMMLHVLMTTDNNCEAIYMVDSIFSLQMASSQKIIQWYKQTDGNLQSLADSIPEDTLNKYIENIFACSILQFTRSETENYFYNAQTMHQFGNPQIYADFALYIQGDKYIFGRIDDLYKQSLAMYREWNTEATLCKNQKNANLYALQKIVENGSLINHYSNVSVLNCKRIIEHFNASRRKLLKEINATQKEYDEYKKTHSEDIGAGSGDDEEN